MYSLDTLYNNCHPVRLFSAKTYFYFILFSCLIFQISLKLRSGWFLFLSQRHFKTQKGWKKGKNRCRERWACLHSRNVRCWKARTVSLKSQALRGRLRPSKLLKCASRFGEWRWGKQSALSVCQIWPSLLARQRVIGLCRPTERRYIIDVSAVVHKLSFRR